MIRRAATWRSACCHTLRTDMPALHRFIPDFYTDEFDASPSWFKKLSIKKMLIVGGENELILHLIQMFHKKVKVRFRGWLANSWNFKFMFMHFVNCKRATCEEV